MTRQIIGKVSNERFYSSKMPTVSIGYLSSKALGSALKMGIAFCTHAIISFFASQYSIGEVV